MSRLLHIRRRLFRPESLGRLGAGTFPYTYVLSPCCPRNSSTFCPTNIAELLKSPPSSSSSQSSSQDGEALTIRGYVRTVRKQKKLAFAALGDGSTLQTVQAVLAPQLAEGLSTGVAVVVTGKWAPSLGQEQSHELQVNQIRILGENDAATYPIQKKYQSSEFLRTVPHLRSRLPFNSLVLRLRSLVSAQVTSYFAKHDFIQCHPPIITSSDCEGAGEVFTVSPAAPAAPISYNPGPPSLDTHQADAFFGSPKYLTVSSQLHLEALAQSVEKVWALSPTFRAEKSDTARHLSEFYMLEAEMAFVEDVKDIMKVVEDLLRAIATELQSSSVGRELLESRTQDQEQEGTRVSHSTLAQRWQGLVDGPWPQITHSQAISLLKHAVARGEVEFAYEPAPGAALQTEHERFLAESVGQGKPVFVTDYPLTVKPFYMARAVDSTTGEYDTSRVACFDLLVPDILELAGGSMREHEQSRLLQSMKRHGFEHNQDMDLEAPDGSLQWYMDLRRYGSVPHGGFGLGFDRLLCYLSGVSNIKDVVSFPRWHKRCDC